MTDTDDRQIERAPQADNALKHGACRYLKDGTLPAELEGLDKEIAGEILKQVGNDEQFRLAATATARAFVVNELIWRHICRTFRDKPEDLPAGLKLFGSYQESLRRFLGELGLTPIAAKKILNPESLEDKHKKLIEVEPEDTHNAS